MSNLLCILMFKMSSTAVQQKKLLEKSTRINQVEKTHPSKVQSRKNTDFNTENFVCHMKAHISLH